MENMNNVAPQGLSDRNLAMLVYFMYGTCFFTGVMLFVAMIVNYIKKSEATDVIVRSHYEWQMRSALLFLFGLLLIFFVFIGMGLSGTFRSFGIFFLAFIGLGNVLWFIYRLVRGALHLNEGRAIA